MATQEQFNEVFNEVNVQLAHLMSYSIEELTREELGATYSFKVIEEDFVKIIAIFRRCREVNLRELPYNVVFSLKGQIDKAILYFDQVITFNATVKSAPTTRTKLMANIQNGYYDFYTFLMPILSRQKMRIGNYKEGIVGADGQWHTIIGDLKGCNIFEVTAIAYGNKGEGKYATLHAITSNAYTGKRGRIHCSRDYYGWLWWRRLRLRWVGSPFNYELQIRTMSDYRVDGQIQFNITKLGQDIF